MHGLEREPLSEFTRRERTAPAIPWYRSPVPREEMRQLHEKSDLRGAGQTLGYLGALALTGGSAWLASESGVWMAAVPLVFLHGTVAAFLINGVHELGHGTVFASRKWNRFFCALLAFLGWINHELFQASHTRHHRYTLHPPDDLEVVLPMRLMVRHFLLTGLVDPKAVWRTLKFTVRVARGRFEGPWEEALFPQSEPERRGPPVRWARILLLGHGLIAAWAILSGNWMVIVLVTLAPFYGSWLFFLCNNTQHIGLLDNVPDFRLCCRTFTLNPLVRFLYWHMNYHTEHHMYAAVPCYNLGRLHRIIRPDLPPTADGLIAVWRQIAEIQKRQDADPDYRHVVALPSTAAPAATSPVRAP